MNEFDKIISTIKFFLATTDQTYYRISKNTGLSTQTIYNLMEGKTDVARVRMDTARTLYEYILEQQKKP